MPAEICRNCGQKLCTRCWECKNPKCSDSQCQCNSNMTNYVDSDIIMGSDGDDGR